MKKQYLILPAAAALTLGARINYECRHFKTEYYEIFSEKIPKAFDGFRFVMLTDLHNYDFDHGNHRLLEEIEKLYPDAIMIAGDMIDASPDADMDTAIHLMHELCYRWPVYFGNGNHEQRLKLYPEVYDDMERQWTSAVSHPNLHLLRNQWADIEQNGSKIRIYGLEMNRKYYQRFCQYPMHTDYLNRRLANCDQSLYNILIAHNPLYFENYAEWGADLVLSGHVHGGVVILPVLGGVISPQVRFFPKYYAGEYHCGGSTMILSRGLHMHSIYVRLNNMPELSCVTLHRS